MNAKLALALLALGPLKAAQAPGPPVPAAAPRPQQPPVEERIAGLAREWLRDR